MKRDRSLFGPWYHGARYRFQDWLDRRAFGKDLSPFHVQPFLSLSRTMACARLHDGGTGTICRTFLRPEARILDMRAPGADLEQGRALLGATEWGRRHWAVPDPARFAAACRTGDILRFIGGPADMLREARDYLDVMMGPARTPVAQIQAQVAYKNFLQRWIQLVVEACAGTTYDAVICFERESPTMVCTQLFVLDPLQLDTPRWP